MLDNFELLEIQVPAGKRKHHKKTAFLVEVDPDIRSVISSGGDIPASLKEIPPHWGK
jgi:hypothetical protein